MANNLSWLDEIEWKDLLGGDARLVYNAAGEQTLRELWSALPSINIYLSEAPLNEARRRYILRYYNGNNIKEMAALLGCSARFVHKVLADRARSAPDTDNQANLF